MEYQTEIHYQHMFLDIADRWAKIVISTDEGYTIKTKLFATLYILVRNSKESMEINISASQKSFTKYPFCQLLLSLTRKDAKTLRSVVSSIRNDYYKLSKSRHSRSLDKLKYMTVEGLFFEILLRERGITPSLFTEDLLERLSEWFSKHGNHEYIPFLWTFGLAYGISLKNEHITKEIQWGNYNLLGLSLLSYFFFEAYKRNNDIDSLSNHYIATKYMMDKLRAILEHTDNPSEETLDTVFKVGVLLHLSGYFSSLSLPNEERIKYLDLLLRIPPLRRRFESIMDSSLQIGFELDNLQVPNTPIGIKISKKFKIPLWVVALVSLLISIGVFIIQITHQDFLSLQNLLIISLVVNGYLVYKLSRLKNEVLKKLERREKI